MNEKTIIDKGTNVGKGTTDGIEQGSGDIITSTETKSG